MQAIPTHSMQDSARGRRASERTVAEKHRNETFSVHVPFIDTTPTSNEAAMTYVTLMIFAGILMGLGLGTAALAVAIP